MSQLGSTGNTLRYGSRYPSTGPSVATRACPVCGGTPPSSRSVYCKTACKQLAYRLRHQQPASVDPVVLSKQLQRQRLLVSHTVYECARCDRRYLGERRCSSCQLYCRALGLGGQCDDCEHIMLLTELLGHRWRHVLMHSSREMGCGYAALLAQSLDNLSGSGGPLQVAHIPTRDTTTTTALRP